MKNKGLPLGFVPGRISRLEGVTGLFNRNLSDKEAVARCVYSLQRNQPSKMAWLNALHTLVVSPSGGGKGSSFIVPFLKTCNETCVVVDFKGENAALTILDRRRMGHKCVVIDPYKMITNPPDSYNPIGLIDPDAETAIDDIRDVVDAMVVRQPDEKDPHWNDCATVLITGLVGAVVAFGEPETRNLQTVRSILTSTEQLSKVVDMMASSDVWGGMLGRLGGQIKMFEGKELASILTTANRHMAFLDSVPIGHSTRMSNWEPRELLHGKVTVYLVLPPAHQRSQSPLIRLWISSLLRLVVNGGMSNRRVHFILDESAALGHLECLEDAVDKYRSYGVRCQFYYQSLGQLKTCWPEGKDQTLLSNTSKVFMGVNDYPTAEMVSNMLGDATIVVNSGGAGGSWSITSSSDGKGSTSHSSSTSDNWQAHQRRLLQPAEVMALDPRIAITFHPGVRPIFSYLVRYYEHDFSRKESGIGLFRAVVETIGAFLSAAILAAIAFMAAFYGR